MSARSPRAQADWHTSERQRIPLSNVHCPDCVSELIEGTLRNTYGVISAEFDGKRATLAVTYAPDRVSLDEIEASIRAAGFGIRDAGEAVAQGGRWNAFTIAMVLVWLAAVVVWLRML